MSWEFDPVLVSLGQGLPGYRWYSLLVVVAFGAAMLATGHFWARAGLERTQLTWLALAGSFGAFVGAHLVHLAAYEPDALADLMRVISLGSGLASHGAALAGVLIVWAFAKKRGASPGRYLDATVSGAVFTLPLFRLANLLNSEIVGRAWDGPWAMSLPRHDCPGYGLGLGVECPYAALRHPAQIYGVLLGVAIVAMAVWLERRHREGLRPGVRAALICFAYCAGRFAIEFTKEFQVLPETSALTMGQWLTLPALAISALLLFRLRPWGSEGGPSEF